MNRQATREVWMELVSPRVLASFMAYRGETVRSLAAKSTVGLGRRGKPLSPAVVGHLRSGKRRTCSPATAGAIERALQVPPGVLFIPRMEARNRVA